MRKMKLFDLSVAGVVKRFYLMMLVVVISGFLGQFTLAAILGFAVAISFILGISYRDTRERAVAKEQGKVSPMERRKDWQKAA